MRKFFLIMGSLMLLGVGCQNEPVVQKKDEVSFQQREKCQELGSKYRKEKEQDADIRYFDPIYGYSVERRTCLYIGKGVISNLTFEFVVDLLTNEKIAHYTSDTQFSGDVTNGDKHAFDLEKARFKLELQNQFDTK